MPSDKRVDQVTQALAGQRDVFRTALGTTVDQVRTFLAEHHTSANGKTGRLEAELGPFAAARIDAERFSKLMGNEAKLDRLTVETIEKARDTMAELAGRDEALYRVDVPPGGCLHDVVEHALENIGRAFGAVRIFELTRAGTYQGNEHARSLGAFPFDRWSRGERRLAPPLVVTVDGADLRAEGLAEFLDGWQKIVLVVRGECAPAPLARLVTPDVFVMQTANAADIDRLAAFEGPAVGAVVPESAARFVHNPAAGGETGECLAITHLPEKEPKGSIGGLSGFQQAQELRQLKALAARPAAAAAPAGEAGPAGQPLENPVDKLAAWLLTQADLSDVE
jgi:hypothetical protein